MKVGEMQKKLSLRAEREPDHRFGDLYSLLYNDTWIRAAHAKVNSNTGRKTPGVDGETMAQFNENLDRNLEELKEQLRTGDFEPRPVRREILRERKPDGRIKLRPLGIPTIRDRLVQEALRMILEPIWEADFHPRSFGFRPDRGTQDAIACLARSMIGTAGRTYLWAIEGDIASYFDTIPHRKLLKCLRKRLSDRKLLDLLWKFLRAGVLEEGQLRNSLTGTPQGGIISPLLANIYLHELDQYMEANYLGLTVYQKRKRRVQGRANFIYVRYADDFVILCNGTKAQAEELKQELSDFLAQKLKLELSWAKTKITHMTEGFQFLGYELIRSRGIKGTLVPKVKVPQEAVDRFRGKLKRVLAPNTHHESVRMKLIALNRIIGGWCRYYQHTSSPARVFNRLRYDLFWQMVFWIGRKYQIRTPAVMRRFYEGSTLTDGRLALVMPTDFKTKRLQARKIPNPYTVDPDQIRREILFEPETIWTGDEERPGRFDLWELILERDGPICAACETSVEPEEAQMDHKTPRARFKRKKDADALNNLQMLCIPCHRAKTTKDLQVLSRMR